MKFEIVKGNPYVAKFVLKENGTTTPLELSESDTGVFSISTSGVSPTIVIDSVEMSITDSINGEFTLELTAEQTSLLEQEVAFKEDGYPTVSNYKGLATFTTASQGIMNVTIEKVYCLDIGK